MITYQNPLLEVKSKQHIFILAKLYSWTISKRTISTRIKNVKKSVFIVYEFDV